MDANWTPLIDPDEPDRITCHVLPFWWTDPTRQADALVMGCPATGYWKYELTGWYSLDALHEPPAPAVALNGGYFATLDEAKDAAALAIAYNGGTTRRPERPRSGRRLLDHFSEPRG